MDAICEQAGEKFEFLFSPMDGCFKIDQLLGTDVYRMGLSAAEVVERYRKPIEAFTEMSKWYWLY